MSTTHEPTTESISPGTDHQPDPDSRGGLPSTAAPVDDWVPDDREPSAAENNFMSFSLFGFLILFGIGCIIFL